MKRWTRREAIGSGLLGGLSLLGSRGLPAQTQKEAHASDPLPASAIIPPNGIVRTEPRLRGIHRVIVDADPGNDDALAILMALSSPQLQVEAITVTPGNMGPRYDQQVRNALYVVDLAGYSGKVPVLRGMSHPILNLPYPIATFIHGKYGLGAVEVTETKQKAGAEHAVDSMLRLTREAPGKITILALGGLTNVAMAILRDPEFASRLQGIVFVGGRYASPGMAPSYNVLVDPEAAHIVMNSGAPITLVGSDVNNRDSILVAADYDRAATFNTRRSRFFTDSNALRRQYEMKYRGAKGSVNADPLAVAIAAHPEVGQRFMDVNVRVELQGEYTRGQLVYGDDIYSGHPIPPGNVDLCVQADAEAFKKMVFETLQIA
ncbi:MAG: nucleoside hydrolase [Acidobacteriaceae bacterium]|nr:nucleoside hydrolase [Acidobacteriaceae bacterium]